MDRPTQHRVAAQVVDQNGARTTTLADAALRIPAEWYVGVEHFERERSALFRAHPVLAGLSVDIPEPGDALTFESGGVPILVVRAPDRGVRAFVNICRHRGTRVVRARTSGVKNFTCPFHGWTYDLEGRLIGQARACGGFADCDMATLGLRPLAAAERNGPIFVRPGGAESFDAEGWLSGLSPDLAARSYDTVIPYAVDRTTWACNWKLLIDTFLESYHVPTLHRESLSEAYLGIASPCDVFGPHNRIVVPQRAILEQTERIPRSEWELLPHAVLQYFIAPNVILSNITGFMMVWRFVADAVDRTTVEHALYTYGAPTTAEERERIAIRWDAARSVTGSEDFPESEVIHGNLASGLVGETIAGRNEAGIVHFHRWAAEACGVGAPKGDGCGPPAL